ncbi:expressed unknown protein [Seminavis robusta]|uniref:Uncharacterized protein n=1 Tax=Seminavis robusta TaxID=568900 RepID=A0A9N8EAL6_9STRA|nr:expressed unknown protein [Seminavis robusta]|eukprot:Sro867_g213150.1 n/a (328) ;mRNA; r:9715-10698
MMRPFSLLLFLSARSLSSQAWIHSGPNTRLSCFSRVSTQTRTTCSTTVLRLASSEDDNRGPLSSIFQPYDTKIPPELRDEIYAAEANTPAAQERGTRVATYALIAFIGIVLAFFNAFITELRNSPIPPEVDITDPLAYAGFSWVASNPITGFLFMNKLGGGICLLGGAGAGLMAEAELDTKRINAEKIFEELQRRREKKEKQKAPKRNKKKRRSGKEKKRMEALSEIIVQDDKEETATAAVTEEPTVVAAVEEKPKEEEGDGLLGKIKGFYDKADSMAASQALLLNKEMEDRGMIVKITDETGLKVIGKEEAAKLQQEKEAQAGKKD